MNVAAVLKTEINRLAAKAIRAQTKATRAQVASHRHSIASMKRELASLRKEVARLKRGTPKPATAIVEGDAPARFSAKGFRAWRARTKLSAGAVAKLLGVSGQSPFNWEHGRTRPRPQQAAQLAALRALPLRELRARVAELEESSATPKAAGVRKRAEPTPAPKRTRSKR